MLERIMKTFLIELDNRPDGITNQSINSYSTKAVTISIVSSALCCRYYLNPIRVGVSYDNRPRRTYL